MPTADTPKHHRMVAASAEGFNASAARLIVPVRNEEEPPSPLPTTSSRSSLSTPSITRRVFHIAHQTPQPQPRSLEPTPNYYEKCFALRNVVRDFARRAIDAHESMRDPTVTNEAIQAKIKELEHAYERTEKTLLVGPPNRMPNYEQMGQWHPKVLHEATKEPEKLKALDKFQQSNSQLEHDLAMSTAMTQAFSRFIPLATTENQPEVIPGLSPQQAFEQAFNELRIAMASSGLATQLQYLERGPTSCVVEVLCKRPRLAYQNMLKFALVVNQGEIDYVHFIAPQEEWKYNEGSRAKVLDLDKESAYDVYRRITVQANKILPLLTSGSIATKATLERVIFPLSRYQCCFEMPCTACQRHMKDFLPPVVVDVRAKVLRAFHETCEP